MSKRNALVLLELQKLNDLYFMWLKKKTKLSFTRPPINYLRPSINYLQQIIYEVCLKSNETDFCSRYLAALYECHFATWDVYALLYFQYKFQFDWINTSDSAASFIRVRSSDALRKWNSSISSSVMRLNFVLNLKTTQQKYSIYIYVSGLQWSSFIQH